MLSVVGAAVDTTPDVERLMTARWRAMTPEERMQRVVALNDACERLAEAGVRSRYPSASDTEVWLRVTALRLGRELMVAAYGWDPDVEGW